MSEPADLPPCFDAEQTMARYNIPSAAALAKRRQRCWIEGVHWANMPGWGIVYYWEEIDAWLLSGRTGARSQSGERGGPLHVFCDKG